MTPVGGTELPRVGLWSSGCRCTFFRLFFFCIPISSSSSCVSTPSICWPTPLVGTEGCVAYDSSLPERYLRRRSGIISLPPLFDLDLELLRLVTECSFWAHLFDVESRTLFALALSCEKRSSSQLYSPPRMLSPLFSSAE